MPTHPSNHAGTSLSACTHTPPQETGRPQSLLSGMDESKLREALAQVAKATKPSAPSPAMNFGAYVRRAVDPEPGRGPSATDLARILRLDPISKEIDQLKSELAAANRRTEALENQFQQPRARKTEAKGQLSKEPSANAGRGRRRRKFVTVKEAGEKLRAKVNAIIVRMTKAGRTGREIEQELIEKVYRVNAEQLATECGYSERAAKTFRRTPEYKSWATYRRRGNANRLDPSSPAVDFTSAGGRSSKSGMNRNTDFAAANELSIGNTRKLPGLDAAARQQIAEDPEAAEWYRQNSAKLDEPPDSEEFVDSP
jgi:hypothetical protein